MDDFGLARTAARIEEIRAEATNAMLLDNGDLIQGNPMGDYMAYEKGLEGGNAHPMIKAMNVLKFDASTLGNHEFNYGLDYLMDALDDADFPRRVGQRRACPRWARTRPRTIRWCHPTSSWSARS